MSTACSLVLDINLAVPTNIYIVLHALFIDHQNSSVDERPYWSPFHDEKSAHFFMHDRVNGAAEGLY